MTPTEPGAAPFQLTAHNLGRRYGRHWVFRGLAWEFRAGEPTAILGANGAGKSTLLSVLAGWVLPTEGTVQYARGRATVRPEDLYTHTTLAAPYLDLPDELTVAETVALQARLKPWRPDVAGTADVVAQARLDGALAARRVRDLSSGMRQRLRLALALLADSRLVLLDEPTANLDRAGIGWYHALTARTCTPERVVLVASNIAEETIFCTRTLNLTDFAPRPGQRSGPDG